MSPGRSTLLRCINLLENVTIATRRVRRRSRVEAEEQAYAWLERMGLPSLATIRDLREAGATMVIATHEMGLARRVADRICFLDGGSIVEEGPPEQMLDAPTVPRTREFRQQFASLREGSA